MDKKLQIEPAWVNEFVLAALRNKPRPHGLTNALNQKML